jgi:hypothetical protein
MICSSCTIQCTPACSADLVRCCDRPPLGVHSAAVHGGLKRSDALLLHLVSSGPRCALLTWPDDAPGLTLGGAAAYCPGAIAGGCFDL